MTSQKNVARAICNRTGPRVIRLNHEKSNQSDCFDLSSLGLNYNNSKLRKVWRSFFVDMTERPSARSVKVTSCDTSKTESGVRAWTRQHSTENHPNTTTTD